MNRLSRNKWLPQAVVFLFILSLDSGSFAGDLGGARLIPKGKVSIYDGSRKVGELSSEAPLPAGKILVSDKKCGVRLGDMYLVATENTRFAVRPTPQGKDVFVQQGRVYFALGDLKDTLTLSTPQETVTVQNSVISASTAAPIVKGYLLFEDNRMEVGVIDGGKLMVTDAGGQQLIVESGKSVRVQKAQADLGGGGAAAGGGSVFSPLVIGVLVAGAVVGGVALTGAFESGDHIPASPSQP